MVDYAQARRTMVDRQVRPADVTDLRIIAALLEVPREIFVPAARRAVAYLDLDVPVSESGRALLKPMVFAKLLQAAGIGATDRVLDVGCATGYSAAVLAKLAGQRRRAGGRCRAGARRERDAGAARRRRIRGRHPARWRPAGRRARPMTSSCSKGPPRSFPIRCWRSSRTADGWSRLWASGPWARRHSIAGRAATPGRAAGVRCRGAAAARLRKARSLRVLAPFRVGIAHAVARSHAATVAPKRQCPAFIPTQPRKGFRAADRKPMIPIAVEGSRRHSWRVPVGSWGQMVGTGVRWTVCAAAVAAVLGVPCVAGAETLESALAQAYRNNPTLNAQRAALRATDEGVPQAVAGYRPRVTGTVRFRLPAFRIDDDRRRRLHPDQHQYQPARRQRRAGADALQRPAHRQPDAPGRVHRARRAARRCATRCRPRCSMRRPPT